MDGCEKWKKVTRRVQVGNKKIFKCLKSKCMRKYKRSHKRYGEHYGPGGIKQENGSGKDGKGKRS